MIRGIMRAEATLSKKCMIAVVVSFLLTGTPLLVQAAQITPNPNPAGSTIDIINDPFAFNNDNPYTNAGTLNLDSSSTLTNSVGAGLTNVGEDATLTNAGRIDNYGGLGATGRATLSNAGTLNNFGGATLGFNGLGIVTNAVGATLNNYGTVGGSADGLLTNAGTLNNFAGAMLSTGSVQPSHIVNTGTLNNFAGATLSNSEGTMSNNVGATLNNYGSMTFDLQTRLRNEGTFNNLGSFDCGSCEFITSAGATVRNSGVLIMSFFGGLQNAGTVINDGSINSGDFHVGGSISNSGTLINTGSIDLPGSYIQTAGNTINNGSMSLASGVDIRGGSLSGTGTITASVVTLSSGATISPGDTTTLGTLTINGNLQSSGNLMFRIGGVGAGQFDVLAIHGMAFLNGGTVGFNFVNFTPVAGNSWDFLYAGALNGWETLQFNLGGLSPNLGYTFNYANGVETLRIVSVPEPDSLVLLIIALGGLALWRRVKSV